MANPVTFGDLDRLLVALGFECRRDSTFLAYTHPAHDNWLFVFPPRRFDDPAGGNHVADVRHHLLWWGLMEEEDFERWLCATRFGDVYREPAVTGAGSGDGTTVSQTGRPSGQRPQSRR